MNHTMNLELFHVRFLNVSIDFKIPDENSFLVVSLIRKLICTVLIFQRFTLIFF